MSQRRRRHVRSNLLEQQEQQQWTHNTVAKVQTLWLLVYIYKYMCVCVRYLAPNAQGGQAWMPPLNVRFQRWQRLQWHLITNAYSFDYIHVCIYLYMLYFYLKSFFFHFYFFFRTTSANTDRNCLWFLLFIYYCLGAEHWRANRSI